MFLNYLAGVVSLVLTISAFVPWVTVWFYSLKGIESIYGISILLLGLLGVTVAAFQHLSGRMRGRAFIIFSLVALACEGLYVRKMREIGFKLNEIYGYLTDIFGEKIMLKIQEILGEQWSKVLVKVVQRLGVSGSLNSFDFLGGGLVLAFISALVLLLVGILLEKNKTTVD